MYVLACIAPQRGKNTDKRVLVLDDNAVSCNVVLAILSDAGFSTDTRATSEDGYAALPAYKVSSHDQSLTEEHSTLGG